MQITTRFPVLEVDGMLVTACIGNPEAEFGDAVTLHAKNDAADIEGLFVAGVDTSAISEVADEVCALFGFSNSIALREGLERAYGTGLPLGLPLTIYTLSEAPVETL